MKNGAGDFRDRDQTLMARARFRSTRHRLCERIERKVVARGADILNVINAGKSGIMTKGGSPDYVTFRFEI